jgi:hypothetical protein
MAKTAEEKIAAQVEQAKKEVQFAADDLQQPIRDSKNAITNLRRRSDIRASLGRAPDAASRTAGHNNTNKHPTSGDKEEEYTVKDLKQ